MEDHKLGETTFTHFADGTAHKNRMQGNDYVTSLMYTHGVTCATCHDTHGTDNSANLRKPANVLCLDCHGPPRRTALMRRRWRPTRTIKPTAPAAVALRVTCRKLPRPLPT